MGTTLPLVKCWEFVGTTPNTFEGEKRYISTGALECDHINEADVEMVTFENRPSRANLAVAPGDILFAKMASTEKTFVVDEAASDDIYSTGFCAVRADATKILPKCLYYFLTSSLFLEQKDKNSSGATQKAITNAGLAKIIINLPKFDEQRAFVAQMDLLCETITSRKQQLTKLDELVKARFVELFGDLAAPNCEWKSEKLVDTCGNPDDIKCGPFGTQLSKDEYQDTGIAVWEIPQINSRFTSMPTHFLTEEKARQLDAYSLKPGDIAMSRKGNVGKCAVFPSHFENGIIHSDVLRIRVDNNRVLPMFMMYQLHNSRAVQHQIELVSSGAIMAGINVTKLKQILVHVPPMDLQKQFVAFVEQTDKSKLAVQQSLEKLETLKKALMQKYFG